MVDSDRKRESDHCGIHCHSTIGRDEAERDHRKSVNIVAT